MPIFSVPYSPTRLEPLPPGEMLAVHLSSLYLVHRWPAMWLSRYVRQRLMRGALDTAWFRLAE
jgi:hypothetical protein